MNLSGYFGKVYLSKLLIRKLFVKNLLIENDTGACVTYISV